MTEPTARTLGRIATVCAIVAILGGCSVETRIINEQRSPAGRLVATVFTVNAGAMTSYVTIVSLRDARATFSRFSGEIFAVGTLADLRVQWLGDNSLLITCIDCDPAKIEAQRTAWKDVTIRYDLGEQSAPTPPPSPAAPAPRR